MNSFYLCSSVLSIIFPTSILVLFHYSTGFFSGFPLSLKTCTKDERQY